MQAAQTRGVSGRSWPKAPILRIIRRNGHFDVPKGTPNRSDVFAKQRPDFTCAYA